jgi:hypothetical protein
VHCSLRRVHCSLRRPVLLQDRQKVTTEIHAVLKDNERPSIWKNDGLMKTIIVVIFIMAVSFASRSQAQTVRDTSGQDYFELAAEKLCGPRVQVRLGPHSALVYLSGECLENRNLNEVARNLAIDGLNAFPESQSFYVKVQDTKGTGEAEVRR